MSYQALLAQAKEKALAGDIDGARALRLQAEEIKAIDAVMPTVDPNNRLPFGETKADDAKPDAMDIAAKSWFVSRYGDEASAMDQVMTELYGRDHQRYAWQKSAAFVKYVRTDQYDSQMHRALVFSPMQVKAALEIGMGVAELKATQLESQDVLGGFLVPEDIRDQIVQRLVGMTAMRKVAGVMSTTRDRVVMPVGTGGDSRYTGAVRAAWVDEAPTAAQSNTNATFGQVTIPIHVLMANVDISKNIIEDTTGAANILTYLNDQFATAFAITEDEAFLVGTGVGRPQGVLQNNGTGGPFTFSYGSVTTLNSGNATALTGDAFRNMPYQIDSQYRNAGCVWVMSRGTVRVIKTLKDGGGAFLWGDRQYQLQMGQPRQLEGYDIMESEALASPTSSSVSTYTANVHPVIFIARNAYQIVDRIGMDVSRYDDSTTGSQNAIRLVARRRLGGQVINPWGVAVMKVSA